MELRFTGRENGAVISFCASEGLEQNCLLSFSICQHERFHVLACVRAAVGNDVLHEVKLIKHSKLLDMFVDEKWHVVRLVVQDESESRVWLMVDSKSVIRCLPLHEVTGCVVRATGT